MTQWMFWLGVAGVMFLLELVTPTAMVSLWFVAGGICAAALSLVTESLWVQALVFVLVSVVLLVLFRPAALRTVQGSTIATNADRVIGKTGTVLTEIEKDGRGNVSVLGTEWRAVSRSGQPIGKGSRVKVTAIEGAKLVVIPAKEGDHV